ncbi:MAG: cytochrome c [Bacteroidota bacterium]|nr:cytochrome c [Bacteroidota bacterium]
MQVLGKFLLWLVAILIGVLILVLAYINFAPVPSYPPPTIKELKVEPDSTRITQGKKIASMVCIQCHQGKDGKLSGKFLVDVPKVFGKIYSLNITKDPEVGIGKWTDGELTHFLRTGLRKDGSYAPPYMPKYPLMADEDLKSIVAWLRSEDPLLEASQNELAFTKITLFSKFLLRAVFKPFPIPEKEIIKPDTSDLVALGRYTANGVYSCFGCHSKDFSTNNDLVPELSKGYYSGGNPLLNLERETVVSSNITMDPETGIGNYTEAEFMETLKTGKKKDGTMVRYPMLPHTALSDPEVKGIYAFLHTVPVIKNLDLKNK